MKVWDWFNGKKTTIGAVLLLIAQGIRLVAPGAEGYAQMAEQVAGMLGAGVTALGLAHKSVK